MLVTRWITGAVLASSLAAQGNVWVVDFASGPGTDFTDLPAAIDAAADGDVLLVRPGLYDVWNTIDGRSLTIAGDGPFVQISGSLFVRNLAADQRVTLRTLVLQYPGQVEARHSDGVVWIEDCTVAADLYGGSSANGAIHAEDAHVVLERTHASGSIQYGFHAAPPTAGLSLIDATAVVHGGSITGGDGLDTTFPDLPGAPGVVASGSTLVLSGTTVTGGTGQSEPGGAGLIATGDSTVTLRDTPVAGGTGTPDGEAFEIEAGSSVITEPGPAHALATTATPRVGDALTVTVEGGNSDLVVLCVSTAPAHAPTPYGTLIVSPAPPAFSSVLGFVPLTGTLTSVFTVPSLGGADSVELYVQELYQDGLTGEVHFGPASAPLLLAAGF